MKNLVMGEERVPVDSAIISEDGRSLTCFLEDGSKAVVLEGVNFANVWLEDSEGERIEFSRTVTEKETIDQLQTKLDVLMAEIEAMKGERDDL